MNSLSLRDERLKANRLNKSRYEDIDIDDARASAFLAKATIDDPDEAIGPDLLDCDPTSYTAAMKSADRDNWRTAMQEEWNSLLINETFQAFKSNDNAEPLRPVSSPDAFDNQTSYSGITVPFGCKPLKCRWIYKTKRNIDGSTKFNARLVIKGYEQVPGIDYDETYAPVSKLSTLRYLLSLSATRGWSVDQMDVVTAFLNPAIDNDRTFMSMPPGIE